MIKNKTKKTLVLFVALLGNAMNTYKFCFFFPYHLSSHWVSNSHNFSILDLSYPIHLAAFSYNILFRNEKKKNCSSILCVVICRWQWYIIQKSSTVSARVIRISNWRRSAPAPWNRVCKPKLLGTENIPASLRLGARTRRSRLEGSHMRPVGNPGCFCETYDCCENNSLFHLSPGVTWVWVNNVHLHLNLDGITSNFTEEGPGIWMSPVFPKIRRQPRVWGICFTLCTKCLWLQLLSLHPRGPHNRRSAFNPFAFRYFM